MPSFRARRISLPLSTCCLLSLLLAPSASAQKPSVQKPDNLNEIVNVTIKNGQIVGMERKALPPTEEPVDFIPEPKFRDEEPSVGPPDKISPVVRQMLDTRRPGDKELLIVSFVDTEEVPRFPDLIPEEPRTSPGNQERLLRGAQITEELKERRRAAHARRMKDFGPRYGMKHVSSFWIIDAMVVRMPLASVRGLAKRADVLYIEPAESGEEPPIGDGNALNDVIDAREIILSDAYFNLTGGYIALIDTGVRPTHVQLTNPNRLGYLRDCVNGTSASYCSTATTGTTLNTSDCHNADGVVGHGTSSAAIMVANANQGNDYRGVTQLTVDSFKVYGPGSTTNCGAGEAAAVRGIEAAVGVGDRVIVAELQLNASENSAVSSAADRAYDAGAAVIAANGNAGPNASTVRAPANAHKVIGVGAVDVQTLALMSYQGRGPTADGRIKPDIQAPTNTETASSASDTALQEFGGTSGSTPYAGGVAALFRNWLINQGDTGSPGQVYAQMILSGQNPAPNNNSGAGLIVMPNFGTRSRGSVSITQGQTIDVPLTISGTVSRLDGAIWWPELAANPHNDIDLYLIAPNGTQYSYILFDSVFERVRGTGSFSGNWTLRIHGYSVPASPQVVYWAAQSR
jgi:serine protease AprX